MDIVLLGSALALIQFLLSIWIKARLESSIKAENDRLLEQYRYEVRAKEQAAKVAEYFSYYFRLKPDSSDADYRNANQLAWELALWLPADVYRKVAKAVATNDGQNNILSSLIEVRGLLLSKPGNLSADELFFHAPNAKALHEATETLPKI